MKRPSKRSGVEPTGWESRPVDRFFMNELRDLDLRLKQLLQADLPDDPDQRVGGSDLSATTGPPPFGRDGSRQDLS